MKNLLIQSNYCNTNKYVILEFDKYGEVSNIVQITKKVVDLLIKHGMNHDS